MPFRTFFATYTLTGTIFLLLQSLSFAYLFPEQSASLLAWVTSSGVSAFGSLSAPMTGFLTTLSIAAGIFLIFISGFILELLAPILRPHETSKFSSFVRLHKRWLEPLALRHSDYLGDCFDVISNIDRTWGEVLNDPKLKLREKLVQCYQGTSKNQLRRSYLAIRSMPKAQAFLAARISLCPANTRLETFAEEAHFWQVCRGVSIAVFIATMEMVCVLMWQLFAPRWSSHELPTVLSMLGVGVLEVIGLVISTWIASRAYLQMCESIFAINYLIWKQEQPSD